MPPRVTVIIPTWNWSSVLPYSIGSVLGQTMTDFELLVIGDGCTDDSEKVVTAIDDRRVRWINIPRTGHQSGPNNEGLRQARGEYIAYLGHDDLWLPHHLAAHCAVLDSGADLAHSILLVVEPDSCVWPLVQAPNRWMPPSGVVHRRAMTEALGGWRDYREISVGPEHDLWLRAEAAGYELTFVPRLTGVKFPASQRPGVYETRPSSEQASWLARIQSEPDLEAVELAKMVAQASERRIPQLLTHAWRLFLEPSQWFAFLWRRKGARIKARQRFKGVEPLP